MVLITFVAVAAAGVLLSLGVERVLRGHLRRVLTDLCETEARMGFWLTVTGLVIVLVGVLSATATFGYADDGVSGFPLFLAAMTQARSVLIGVLGILLTVAFFLLGAIRRYEARTRPYVAPPPPAAPR